MGYALTLKREWFIPPVYLGAAGARSVSPLRDLVGKADCKRDVSSRTWATFRPADVVLTVTGWLDRRERKVLAYLIEEESGPAASSWVGGVSGSPMTTGANGPCGPIAWAV